MKVYIVFDNCPTDFGEPRVVSAHASPIGADSRIKKLRAEDEFKNQYLERQQFELEG